MIADNILAMYSNESTLWLLLSVFMGYHTCSGNSKKDLLLQGIFNNLINDQEYTFIVHSYHIVVYNAIFNIYYYD